MIHRMFILLLLSLLIAGTATIASAEEVVLSADSQSFVTNIMAYQNNLVVFITLALAGLFLGHSVLQLILAHRNAKTEQDREQARQTFVEQLSTMLKDEYNRNATERTLMAEKMLPVRTFLEIVGEVSAILGAAGSSKTVNEFSDFLKDVTQTEEDEDLSIEYRADNGHLPPDVPPELIPAV
jgi:hypothetical protein